MNKRPRLPDHVYRELESNFRAGRGFQAAALSAGVTRMTAYRHFKHFAAAGIPRATPVFEKKVPTAAKLKRERKRKPNWFNPEPYTGPVWIGDAITPTPDRSGSNWIGKGIAP